jgi:hypothetical protein
LADAQDLGSCTERCRGSTPLSCIDFRAILWQLRGSRRYNAAVAGRGIYKVIACHFVIALLSRAFASTTESTTRPEFEIPLDGPNHPIFIPVTWQGKLGYFILDTGSAISVLDEAAFPDLVDADQNGTAVTPLGSAGKELYQAPSLVVGPVELWNSKLVWKGDFSLMSRCFGRRILGILGVSSIKDFVVQIDFDQKKLRFLKPDFEAHPEWGRARGMESGQGTPVIMIDHPDGPFPAIMDTGSGQTASITPQEFDTLWHQNLYPMARDSVTTLDGTAEVRVMRSSDFEICGRRYRNLVISENRSGIAFFGLPFFYRHVVTFDFPDYIFYLKPGKQFDRTDEIDMSGLQLSREDGQVFASVKPDSPAFTAGLRDDDTVLTVNGIATDKADLVDLEQVHTTCSGYPQCRK